MSINLPIGGLRAILVVFSIIVTGCAKDNHNERVEEANPRVQYDSLSSTPWVSYIVEPGNELNLENSNHIRKALNYSKIPYNEISRHKFNQEPSVANSVKVIVVYDLKPFNKPAMNFLINFVARGGHIFIPTVGTNKNFGFLAGVKEDADFEINTTAQGFLFQIDFLPAFKGKHYSNQTKHYGLKANNFRKEVEVLATSFSEENYPLIIENKIGNGSVISFNTEQYSQKQERGLFFAAILKGLENVAYPVANASSIMLDDFPAPLYNVKMEPVASEMDITQARFYTEVWWKDMLKLANEEGLTYSAYVCFDYSNHTSPPFNFPEWERSALTGSDGANAADKLMIDLKKSRHELAFHGYNHASLTSEEWPNKVYMGLSLQAVKKRWTARGYGALPVSYVPPSNIIDSTGFIVLEENMNDIIYNASIYLGDFEEGGDREFDPEPYNYHFFNFPRISSGYAMTPNREFNQQSLYLYTGIWTHFIHPDDIYQIPGDETVESAGNYTLRNLNNYGWRKSKDGTPGLLPRFQNYIQSVKKTFPLIRFLKVSEAAKITKNWREIPYEFSETQDSIKVVTNTENSEEGENFWFAYVSEINSEKMMDFLKDNSVHFSRTPFLDGFLFNIQTREKKLSLPNFKKRYSENLLTSLLGDYESYLLVKPSGNLENIEKEIEELKLQITESRDYNRETWSKLFQYLSWENRQKEIWPLLEEKYNENESSVYVNLSMDFTAQSDYPGLETRKRWMLRQIDLHPEDVKLRRDFIGHFGSNTEVQLSEAELLELIENTDLEEERFSYFLLLNEKYPTAAFDLVKDLEPCREDFSLAASTISWIFADARDYKQAILWSACSKTIDEDVVDDWRIQSGEYKFLKEKNFPLYIEYLIADNDKRAAQELLEIPACREDLKPLATTIVYTYAGQGSYRKALEWSSCIPNFPLVERMQWLYSLGNHNEIENLYADHSEKKNKESAVQIFMAEFYMGRGQIVEAWRVTSELPSSANKERLRRQLNRDVVYVPSEQKRLLLKEYPTLFYPEVAAQLEQNLRMTEGDFLQVGSDIISDRLDPTSFGAEAVYGIRDKKFHQHQLGVSHNKAYAIPSQTEMESNRNQELFGLVYKFKTKERIGKLNYGFGSRLEFNEDGKAFLHLNALASIAKDSLYSSFQIFRKPAITGPAYQLGIYQTQINIYEELQFKENFQAVLYLEGNHYDDEDVMDVQALTSLAMNIKLNKRAKLRPYTEVSGMLGNTSRPSGFPYWTLDERLYGGLGAGYEYINEKNFWKVNLDAGYFLDTFSDRFQRYRGSILWPITKYLHFNAQAEFYTLENFYSNNLTFGLKYFLKDN